MPDVNDVLLSTFVERWSPATCRHRCPCSCHRSGLTVKHVMACCTGCTHGHTEIALSMLEEHERVCHSIPADA
jgi:hypothetical protein